MVIWRPREGVNYPSRPWEREDWVDVDKNTLLPVVLGEMAKPKSWMVNYLSSTAAQGLRYDHLLKLFYFRDNKRDFNGWSVSVWKGLNRIYPLKNPKGKDKLPDAQFIYTHIWGDSEDAFEYWHRGTLKDFNNKGDPEFCDLPYVHAGGDEKTAGAFVKDYHLWLAKELARDGKVSKEAVQDQLKIMLKDENYGYTPK